MSLDRPRSDAELLALHAERTGQRTPAGIVLGPNAVYVAPRSKRASPRAIEHRYQRTLVEWAWSEATLHIYPELAELFAVPNGGARSKATAGMLKAEGVRAGVLDLYLLVPRGGYHGFAHELKVEGRKPTAAQLEEIRALCAAGYDAGWGVGWEHGRDRLLRYVALPPPSRR